MAKKKTGPKTSASAADRVTVVNVKGSEAFREWLATASDETLIPASAIVRAGLALWAEKMKRPGPPKL